MDEGRRQQLQDFVAYAKTLDGDEKGEAQVFLDRLFRAFSRGGYKEAGAKLEERVSNDRGGTSFADLVWKPVVLIEMKKRGEDLSRHLKQAIDYWTHLVPNRPKYVVLCNFDEFRVYDFNFDINKPQDTIALADLPERYGPLNFLWPTNEQPVFKVDREKVTREAADLLAAVYRRLAGKKLVGPATAQRFVLQALVCLFSEDIGLLPKHFFTQLLAECTDPPKAFDLLDGLFKAMNAREGIKGGRFAKVPYFNGGIFAQSAAVELDPQHEIAILKNAASYNWSDVSPDIFGTIFQHSMDAEERHAMGAHYTSQEDIMRIVGPTIVQPFSEAIDRADSIKQLNAIRDRLTTLRVLDPACGSGNFLYIAYREMRRIEAAIVTKQSEIDKKSVTGQAAFGHVSPAQFFGMDVLPFAVELAKVTLSLAPKLASDELHTSEKTLPLDNLDRNIEVKDALIDANGHRAVWPQADVIIGNPPFLGAKRLKPERGADYVNAVRKAYPEVPGMADYCVYWFRRAHDHLPAATPADPFAGRAGLVGTQNIRNNQSRVGGLDHIVKDGVIVDAVENMPWSGEANVHVSIANWVKKPKAKATEAALLIPKQRRLWSKVELKPELFDQGNPSPNPKTVTKGKRGKVRKDKSYEMRVRDAASIGPSLSDEVDVSVAASLGCNTRPKRVFQGVTPGHPGFVLSHSERTSLVRSDPASKEVIHPYLTGREIVLGDGSPERHIIDFQRRDINECQAHPGAFAKIEKEVLPERLRKAKEGRDAAGNVRPHHKQFLDRWWALAWDRKELFEGFRSLRGRFVACSRVTKRPVFVFVSTDIWPSDKIQAFLLDDDYSYGVLQSDAHWMWFVVKCSKLTERFSYSIESVFDTFPWPQSPSKKQVRAVAAAARKVRAVRAEALPTLKGGLRALYRTLELPGANPLKDAHEALNAAVLDAYGFEPGQDILKQLLDLNLAVAASIDKGKPVTAPGVPPSYGDPADLITDDCIRP
jgi:SAM-dependent methyltransferase